MTCFSRSLASSCFRICERALQFLYWFVINEMNWWYFGNSRQCAHNIIWISTNQYDILLKCSVNRVRFGDRSSHCSCAHIRTSGISIFWNSSASNNVICSAMSADFKSNNVGGLVIMARDGKMGFDGTHFCCLKIIICREMFGFRSHYIYFHIEPKFYSYLFQYIIP